MHLILKVFQIRYINAVMDLSLKGVNTNFEHIQIFFSDFSFFKKNDLLKALSSS